MGEEGKDFFLKAVVKGFEGKFALLETEDNQKIRWPIKNIPEDAQENSEIRILVSTNKSAAEDREEVAKAVLNRILEG